MRVVFVVLFQYANKSVQSTLPRGLGPYEDKSTQTYFPDGLGPLTDESALEEQDRRWRSRMGHYNRDVRELLMVRFWRWEERHIKAAETQLSDFRESRKVAVANLHRYLDRTHGRGVEPNERNTKRRRRMSH